MADFSSVIVPGNLKFGSIDEEGISLKKGLPSLYFLDPSGLFVCIRPYHEERFNIIKKKCRQLFFLTGEEYKSIPRSTGALLRKHASQESVYDGIHLRKGGSYRVVAYTNPAGLPHEEGYLAGPGKLKAIYEDLGIGLNNFIAYCSENTEKSNNAYIGEGKRDIIDMLREGFPLYV